MKSSVRAASPRSADAQVAALRALAHPARFRAFLHLVRAGREVSAGELADALAVPAPTLTHQLDRLRRAGLVSRRRSQRFVYYQAERPVVAELARLLTNCC